MRRIIKTARNTICPDTIDKSLGIHSPDSLYGMSALLCGNHRVKQMLLLALIAANTHKMRGVVVGVIPDHLIHFLRVVSNNKQRLLPVPLVQHMQNLRAGKLENNGIQRFLPSKQDAGYRQHNHIPQQHIIPGVHALALGIENCDKIRTAAAGIAL